MDIRKKLGKELLILDGACGTALQVEYGLKPGERPENWCFEKPNIIENLHLKYLDSGSDIILTNTFGTNAFKFGKDTEKYIKKAVEIAKKATSHKQGAFVALDIGPTGKLMVPYGDLEFEEAYDSFKEVVLAGEGVDLVLIETMSDLYEMKAAILAVKENSNLPIIASVTLDSNGKTLTGGDIETVATVLEGLGVDVIGLNCGFGPDKMIGWVKELREYTNLPIMIKPNAGMPVMVNNELHYDVDSIAFKKYMLEGVKAGAYLIGGCCGTTPEYIKQISSIKNEVEIQRVEKKVFSRICSYGKTINIGDKPLIIGERINPTGKKKLKEALRAQDLDYVKAEAIKQIESGAHILDVNVGLPEINETEMLAKAIKAVQGVTNTPLQIDTANIEALEKALRIYNGIPLINSVNGKQDNMDALFPLAQKYGAMLVALTLDEEGINSTTKGRIAVAKKLIDNAKKHGIGKEKLLIDPLAMTISTGSENAIIVLEIIKALKEDLKVKCVLGVSNISFGLPSRANINAAFYMSVLQQGLDVGIIDPTSEAMINTYYSYMALSGRDDNFQSYIKKFGETKTQVAHCLEEKITLEQAVLKGLKKEAEERTKELLESGMPPLEIVSTILIPTLNKVGDDFENFVLFLPQLLSAAESAKGAFDIINESIKKSGVSVETRGKIILATVEGDVHDIGKNIVKVILENYGYDVIDLGRDVKINKVVDCAVKHGVKLVGLSALMTTTVENMEKTIKALRKKSRCKIMVGGAVLTEFYAKSIGADYYAKDAMASVKIAEEVFAD